MLRKNLSYYLKLSATEDVLITKNGKAISKLSNPYKEKINNLRSVGGIIASGYEEIDIREERLSRQ